MVVSDIILKLFSGGFSPQEEEDLSEIDEDFQLFGFSGFNFFMYKGYGCLSFSASPDDNRYGSKTVFFVEGAHLKTEVLEALEEAPFVKKQFRRLADMYGVELPKMDKT